MLSVSPKYEAQMRGALKEKKERKKSEKELFNLPNKKKPYNSKNATHKSNNK